MYLKKFIRFITFAELHFKLATRKSSAASIVDRSFIERTKSNLVNATTTITSLSGKDDLNDPVLLKGFEKALKDTSKESDLDRRLNNIKSSYETNKYDELQTRLSDAESKNEYLSKIIAQLQSKRSAVNSSFRLDHILSNQNR